MVQAFFRLFNLPSGISMQEINVKELRLRLGLTQERLAQKLGVSLISVHNWERGTRRPSPLAQEALLRWAKQAERERRKASEIDLEIE